MKVKELTLASIFIPLMIAQNYILFALPITLTYLIIYMIGNKVKSNTIKVFSIMSFVIIKNMLTVALPLTIIADFIGLTIFILISNIKLKRLEYIIFPILIVFHILLMDISTVIQLGGPLIPMVLAQIATGFVTYIYSPMSVVLIYMYNEIEVLTEYEI